MKLVFQQTLCISLLKICIYVIILFEKSRPLLRNIKFMDFISRGEFSPPQIWFVCLNSWLWQIVSPFLYPSTSVGIYKFIFRFTYICGNIILSLRYSRWHRIFCNISKKKNSQIGPSSFYLLTLNLWSWYSPAAAGLQPQKSLSIAYIFSSTRPYIKLQTYRTSYLQFIKTHSLTQPRNVAQPSSSTTYDVSLLYRRTILRIQAVAALLHIDDVVIYAKKKVFWFRPHDARTTRWAVKSVYY